MDELMKEELLKSAKCGDINAMKDLIDMGVNMNDVFQTDTEDEEDENIQHNYLFIVFDGYYDYFQNEMITTNFKKAFDYAYNNSYKLQIWIDGEKECVLECEITKDLKDTLSDFKNKNYRISSDLKDIAIPTIEAQKKIYDEEKRKEQEEKDTKLREKEMKELERLKAKYEK
jgi:hypothetical protein